MMKEQRHLWVSAFVGFPVAGWLLAYLPGFAAQGSGNVSLGMLLTAVLISAYTDFRWRRIYNAVTYPAFFWLLAMNAFATASGSEWPKLGAVGLGYSLLGALACLFIAAIPYVLSSGGAGDAKLGAVIGSALGIEQGIMVILISYVVAGVMAVVIVIWDRGPVFIIKTLYHRWFHWFLPLWITPVDEEQQKLLSEPFPMAPSFLIGLTITTFSPLSDVLNLSV